MNKVMIKRSLTGVFIVLFVGLIICFSYIPGIILCATVLLSALSIYEMYRAAKLDKRKWLLIVSVIVSALLILLPVPHYEFILGIVFLLSLVLFGRLIYRYERELGVRSLNTILVMILLVLMLKAVPLLRAADNGLYYLILSVAVCFISDAFAYFIGSKFGKHKLSPKVSSKKTTEGAVAGVLLPTVIFLLLGTALTYIGCINVNIWLLGFYSVSVTLIGMFGDLALSVVKRICGVKDFGRLLPGHGGILDRFDSFIFSVSYTLLFCAVTGGFIS